ncbi:hypothetical protein [Streptomyces chartreusis]|uniref:hypothetical protein n=1 Tax=Streptomyces chartreusis TaxID=1969 RepID=UPI0036A4F1FF
MPFPRLRASAAAFVLAVAASAGLLLAPTAHAAPSTEPSRSTAGPFAEPDFAATCVWHEFGEAEKPPWWLLLADPLCVEYSKRDITVDDGGALRFLAAEPARFAVTMLTCHYYQKDHWSVQPTAGATPWVAWDGQYWWDKTTQRAGARLTNFRINGHTAGIGDVVGALRPSFPAFADALSDYGQMAGETGLTVGLPYDPRCGLAR